MARGEKFYHLSQEYPDDTDIFINCYRAQCLRVSLKEKHLLWLTALKACAQLAGPFRLAEHMLEEMVHPVRGSDWNPTVSTKVI